MRRRFITQLAVLALTGACSAGTTATAPAPAPVAADTAPPAIVREMRGLWVATVANIDWPSRSGLTADQQRAELTDVLDRAASAGFNTIVLQVRPAANAVYASALEPWAELLSGTQGTDPGYDPLAFAVVETHVRGMELHAWINPFRAGNARDTSRLAPTHLWNTRRALTRVYGAQLWLDPGDQAVQDHVMRVVSDIVSRYDVDAVHADDYFYPYQARDAAGRVIDFPDSATYAASGGPASRDDWRRANVDRFIERMYREVHAIKPTLKKKSGGAVAASLAPLYVVRALVPASPWLDATPPPAPTLMGTGRTLAITPGAGETARWFHLRARVNGAWVARVLSGPSDRSPWMASPLGYWSMRRIRRET